MRSDLKPYPVYKNSDVEWLGQVPVHWETRRLKLAFSKITGGSTPSSSEAAYWDGDIVWVTPADVSRSTRLYTSLRQITQDGLLSCSTELAPAGSIIVTSRAPVGNVAIAETELCTNQGCKTLVATPDVVDPMFGFNILTTIKDELQSLAVGTTFTEISTDRIGSVRMPLPPLLEQAAIVRYLDYMDRRIQRYIRAKQKLIKLLEEQKQAIIHQSVTGRIDVRTGKPYPAYKPSGVEWLGDVPEHWEVNPLGRVLMQRKERNDPIKTTNILSLSLKTGVIPYADKEAGGNKAKEDLSAYMLAYPGDIVVNSMNVVVGSVGISKYFGAVSPVYYMLRPRDPYDPVDYTGAIFQNTGFQRSLFGLGNGIMYIESKTSGKLNTIRLRIPMTRLKKVMLPRPPSEEQSAIVRHLFKVISESTAALESTESQIVLLHEFRTRLISDVVTGKLDVREAAANLPDELEEDLLEDQEQEEETDEDLEDGQQTGDEE